MNFWSKVGSILKKGFNAVVNYEVKSNIAQPTIGLNPAVAPIVKVGGGVATEALTQAIDQDIAPLVETGGVAPGTDIGKDLSNILAWAGLDVTLGALTEVSPSIAFLVQGILNTLSEKLLFGEYRDLDYIGNWRKPNRIIDSGSAVNAFFRGIITKAQLTEHLRKEGFDAGRVEEIINTSTQLMNLGTLINLRFRGEIKDDKEFFRRALAVGVPEQEAANAIQAAKPLTGVGEAITFWRRDLKLPADKDSFEDMRRQGWTDERIDILKKASYALPNIFEIQDFKVREVDNPEVVNKFQLDAFIDEDYFTQARKLGFDRQTAQRIYRYYWNVPSLFIVRELYTTGQISEQDFRDLLKFSRFTPYWIDRLATQLKPKLTLANITEEYKYQIITADQVAPELVKIGYTADLAEQHAKIIIAKTKLANNLDSTSAQTAVERIKGDSEGLILKAYKDKVITRAEALTHLETLKYLPDTAALLLEVADYDQGQQVIKDTFALVKDELAANAISFNDAVNALSKAGATTAQLDLYTAELQKIITHKPAMPTLAKLEAWYKKSIINIGQFAIGLSLLGYADNWIPYYLTEMGAVQADIDALNLGTAQSITQTFNV